ncbi:FKBP-type peptidyl-prolyl isomerase-like protein [Pontibacter ummariensis]|uniref:Peptidyl-prolyl cis-trans isomerase n=1 Tax=Pontibacter ummariensis TaxID=1610492 RepID=A0A239HEH2_9BACT|nr:FKBP-type peptidyl-prolyl cis-trans isomerase [Pontibacter ummariensis]PRY10636.1 FKBP-type peptidyl-prolyl isomerase-like protein [Pontibacter ummariensis]SNS79418.1 FKBP-type peptidyl-prolyl cis-trans isomerase [Pontibacter ummariensis]
MQHIKLFFGKRSSLLQALFFLFSIGLLASCGDDTEPFDPIKQREIDDRLLLDYMVENGVDTSAVVKTASGLYYEQLAPGTGPQVESGDEVEVKYSGKLLNGTEFDKGTIGGSPTNPLIVGAGMVIRGWDEGLKLMQEGEKARLYIPSHLAYGRSGSRGAIPPNAPLVFDMEILDIK